MAEQQEPLVLGFIFEAIIVALHGEAADKAGPKLNKNWGWAAIAIGPLLLVVLVLLLISVF